MLPRSARLSESRHVVTVVRRGESFNGRHLRVVALRQPGEAQKGLFTVVVSKKTAKLAVTRNRLKRRVRAALAALPVPENCWGVVFPRLTALEAPFSEIKADLSAWAQQWLRP